MTELPICVGFGISQPKHIASLQNVADGAIVGSAIVKKMTELLPDRQNEIPAAVGEYCKSLISTPR